MTDILNKKNEALRILQVEDDLDDVLLTARALQPFECPYRLNVVNSGRDALRYLRKMDEFEGVTTPHVILLDLNLPGIGGCQVLKEIRKDDRLSTLPVIILTTSKNGEDLLRSEDLEANFYVTKSTDLSEFSHTMLKIMQYWFKAVQNEEAKII